MVGDGGSVHTRRWATGLLSRGHAVYLLTERPWDEPPLDVELLPRFVRGRFNLPVLARQVREAAARFRPDLVQAHYASSYGLIAALSRVRPLVVSVWGGDVEVFPRNPLNRQVLVWTLRQASRIAVTSGYLERVTSRLVPAATLDIIPWGLDDAWLENPRAGEPPGPFTVVNNKHLEPTYGLDILLEAMAGIDPPWVLWLLGSGGGERELRGLAAELGVAERVRWPGQVSPQAVREVMDQAHVAAFPSRRESFSVATLEASARGLPVIGSNTGGIPEVIRDGATGILVEPNDMHSLRTAMKALWRDPALRGRMGAAGRAMVRDHFRWTTSLDRMEAVYRAVLGQ
jgi:glycosyltransferase involved in cell wall biosynthesis